MRKESWFHENIVRVQLRTSNLQEHYLGSQRAASGGGDGRGNDDGPPACVKACYAEFYAKEWCGGKCFDPAKTCVFYTSYLFGTRCASAALRPSCGAGELAQLHSRCVSGCNAQQCTAPHGGASAATNNVPMDEGPPACVKACYA